MAPCLCIVGVGLIGGSFALAAREAGLFDRIVALEPNPGNAQKALELGLVDDIVEHIPADCDAVLLACPSNETHKWLQRLRDHSGIVFDVASVKGAMMALVRGLIGALPANYVPCHQIAGLEKSGPAAADRQLFVQKLVIITPTAETDPRQQHIVENYWHAIGARTDVMDPTEHDHIYALTSHLPHLLAFAYLQGVTPEHLEHTGGGFRDFSRIGASDPDMWSAIFELNKQALLPQIRQFQENLEHLQQAIERGDVAVSRALIEAARTHRTKSDDD